MVFHWSLSDSKSPQFSGTRLRILAVLSNAVVWIVSTCQPTSKSSRPFNNPFVIVPLLLLLLLLLLGWTFYFTYYNDGYKFWYSVFFLFYFELFMILHRGICSKNVLKMQGKMLIINTQKTSVILELSSDRNCRRFQFIRLKIIPKLSKVFHGLS